MRIVAALGIVAISTSMLAGCITIQVPAAGAGSGNSNGSPNNPAAGSVECHGQALLLNRAGGRYTLSGGCGAVSIQGQDIVVELDDAASITINGDRVTVDGDSLGPVSISGQNNSVTADTVKSLKINGDRNMIKADSAGAVAVGGNDNSVDADTVGSVNDS
ncbi:MAG: hypothetical protein JWO10_801, partial [Microbacteriaceae bacterium]|nr:hypothetical protein [Microbacteriaceae bacterium]